jgi:signal transduction histidine kinase
VKGQQQQQQKEEEQQNETLQMLQTILRNANRLHQLTEDILDATRIESNTLKLRKEKFSLNDVILNVVEDCRKQVANSSNNNESSVKVTYEPVNSGGGGITSTNILVEADRRRLTQVISNLLNNAIKFTKEGTVTVSTSIRRRKEEIDRDGGREGGVVNEEVKQEKEEEDVVIAIKDTGTGIDTELMPRLFTKFATKSYQGTGLGLYISKSIVEAHGGKIWAENNNSSNSNSSSDDHHTSDSDTKHNGATFYFTLPIADVIEERRGEKGEARVVNGQLH